MTNESKDDAAPDAAAKPDAGVADAPLSVAVVEPQVRQRTLGGTGLSVSELALGTWGLSGEAYGPVGTADAQATIEKAIELGIRVIDTSDAYEGGEMERRLGGILAPHPEVRIVTRHGVDRQSVPVRKCFDPEYLRESFARSQDRFKRDTIDVFMLHNPGVTAMIRSEIVELMTELKTKKQILAWGVAAGDIEIARMAVQGGADVVSMPYNVLVGSDLQALAADIAEHKTGILAHSVLAYGLLVGTWDMGKMFPVGDHRRDRWEKAELQGRIGQLSAVRSLLSSTVHTLRSASLRFVLENALVSSVILGPRSVGQLEQLVREAGKGPPYLDELKFSKLPRRLRTVGIEP